MHQLPPLESCLDTRRTYYLKYKWCRQSSFANSDFEFTVVIIRIYIHIYIYCIYSIHIYIYIHSVYIYTHKHLSSTIHNIHPTFPAFRNIKVLGWILLPFGLQAQQKTASSHEWSGLRGLGREGGGTGTGRCTIAIRCIESLPRCWDQRWNLDGSEWGAFPWGGKGWVT